MKNKWYLIVILIILAIFVIGAYTSHVIDNSDYEITENKTTTVSKTKYVNIKYIGTVNIAGFDSFNTSKSSFIDEAYYDSESQHLIMNLTGTYYQRCDVPEYIWEDFKDSDSLGGFFNKYIKGEYDCRDRESEEAEQKAEEESKAKEEQEKIAAQKQLEIQQQKNEAKNKMCDSLRVDANKAISEIQASKSNVFCNKLNNQYAQIEELEKKVRNVNSEVNSMYKGDVPAYIVNSTAANLKSKYQDEIDGLYRQISNYSIRECNDEQIYNRKRDELILQRQQKLVDEGC